MRIHVLAGTLVRSAISCALMLIGLTLPAHAYEDLWHGKIQILSPTPGQTFTSVPLEVRIRITGFDHDGDRDDKFHVWLNGESITRQLGPAVHDVRRVFLYNRNLLAGENRLTVETQGEKLTAKFRYEPTSSTLPGSTPAPPTYVPIKTRVLSNGTYSVQVGPNNYAVPESGDEDPNFQVVVLDRQSLRLVSNKTYVTEDRAGVVKFGAALKSPTLTQGCGEFGCLVIVQSVQSQGHIPLLTANFETSFIGGTYELNAFTLLPGRKSSNYSLITTLGATNTGAPQGTGYERIECAEDTQCPGVGVQGNAQISGVLLLDNINSYTFLPTDRIPYSTGTTPNSWSNGVFVDGVTYWSDNLQGEGGFQLVVFDRSTLSLISNNTYRMPQLGELADAINSPDNKGNMNRLFFVSSIGNITKPDVSTGLYPSWYKFESALREIGGTYYVTEQLRSGDDYSLIGAFSDPNYPKVDFGAGYVRFAAQEASSVISRTIQPAGATLLPSNTRGILKRDHEGYFYPGLSNLTSSFNTTTMAMLDRLVLQAPVAWPYPQADQPGQQAAYNYLGPLACNCTDLRSAYDDVSAPLSSYQDNLPSTYESGHGFSPQEFTLIRDQLNNELTYAVAIQRYYRDLKGLYTDNAISLSDELSGDYRAIKKDLYVPPPPDDQSTLFDILGLTSGAFSIASYITPLGPEVQLALDAASVGFDLTENFIHDDTGAPALNQNGQLSTTYGTLSFDAANHFQDQLYQLGNIFDLVLSDWGKLSALGEPLSNLTINWSTPLTGEVLGNYDRSIRAKLLISLMGGVFSVEHEIYFNLGGAPLNRSRNWIPAGNGPQYVIQAGEQAFPAGSDGQTPSSTNDGQYWDGYALWNTPPIQDGGLTPDPVSSALLIPFFGALNPYDPSQLGQYAPWFYTRDNGIPRVCFDAGTPANEHADQYCPESFLSSFAADFYGRY